MLFIIQVSEVSNLPLIFRARMAGQACGVKDLRVWSEADSHVIQSTCGGKKCNASFFGRGY